MIPVFRRIFRPLRGARGSGGPHWREVISVKANGDDPMDVNPETGTTFSPSIDCGSRSGWSRYFVVHALREQAAFDLLIGAFPESIKKVKYPFFRLSQFPQFRLDNPHPQTAQS